MGATSREHLLHRMLADLEQKSLCAINFKVPHSVPSYGQLEGLHETFKPGLMEKSASSSLTPQIYMVSDVYGP